MKLRTEPNHDTATPSVDLEVELMPLRVKHYPLAFEAWRKDDEASLFALMLPPACLPPGVALTDLTAESYEELAGTAYGMLAGFFAWCGRRVASQAMRSVTATAAEAVSRGLNSSPVSRARPV